MLGIVPYHAQADLAPAASPPTRPTSTWDWYRQIRALESQPPETPMQSAVTGLRHNAESGVVGAALGLISGKFGLDVKGKYPIDAALAALCYMVSVGKAGDALGIASDIREIGQTCTAVWSFRTMEQWAKKSTTLESIPGNTLSNTSGFSDPIMEAGKLAGL